MRVALVLAVMGLFTVEAKAYDFAIRLSNGDSLYFNITDMRARHVEVMAPASGAMGYYDGHTQPSGALFIPETVDFNGQRYTVTAIGERAFSGCTKIQMVIIPSSVREIGPYAFYGCTGIKERVTIGENVRSIGASAFYGCSFLPEVSFRAFDCSYMGGSVSMTVFGNCRSLRKVLFGEGVKCIPDYAFCGVDAISDSIVLPSSLQFIGDFAFAYCSSLSGNMVIPDKVESIGECAFHQCHSLRTLTLGASLKHIGDRAFFHCVSLRRVKVTSYIPTAITSTSFADLPRSVKFQVPCVSKSLYEKDVMWKKYAPFGAFGSCTFSVTGSMDNAVAGMVIGGGNYRYGDSVTITAVCSSGYGFDGWSDGCQENPRGFLTTGNVTLTAKTRPSGTIVITDTLYLVDTVYAEGYKVVHDTVDLSEVALSINNLKEVQFDAKKKRLKWLFPRSEKVVNVSLYNQMGECVYSGDGRRGSVNMRRLTTGSYIVRIETHRRVLRCRFFMNADSSYQHGISVQ